MTIHDDIEAAKKKAVADWLAAGARGSLHMRQVVAAEDVVIADLERLRLLMKNGTDDESGASPGDENTHT